MLDIIFKYSIINLSSFYINLQAIITKSVVAFWMKSQSEGNAGFFKSQDCFIIMHHIPFTLVASINFD